MENLKLLQAVSDISYIAGNEHHYTGNSRFDIAEYISWAKEFEIINRDTDWASEDYMLLIEEFAHIKLKESATLFS